MSEHACPECGQTFDRAASMGRHRLHRHGIAGSSKSTTHRRKVAVVPLEATMQIEAVVVPPARQRRPRKATAPAPSTFELCVGLLRAASPSGTVRIDDLPEVVDWMRQTHELIAKVSAPST